MPRMVWRAEPCGASNVAVAVHRSVLRPKLLATGDPARVSPPLVAGRFFTWVFGSSPNRLVIVLLN
jgi:hypothetical protein